MMPSHDIGVQGRELCSDRRSTCDCSRRAAPRHLVHSSPRLTRSTAHRTIACGVPCHSPRQISCGAPPNAKNTMCAGPLIARLRFEARYSRIRKLFLECRITVPRLRLLQMRRTGRVRSETSPQVTTSSKVLLSYESRSAQSSRQPYRFNPINPDGVLVHIALLLGRSRLEEIDSRLGNIITCT